jgi:hypothetical protein
LRKFAPAATIAACALAVVTGAASAQGGRGGTTLTPGVLEASGDGIAAAGGKLTIHICADEGILLTKGHVEIGEDAFTDEVGWLGLHVYFDFHGCADVTSETWMATSYGGGGGAAALVVGIGLTLRAEGTGIAFLKGEGTWAKTGGDSGEWTEDGAILKIGTRASTSTPCPELGAQHDGGDWHPTCKTPQPTATSNPDDPQ